MATVRRDYERITQDDGTKFYGRELGRANFNGESSVLFEVLLRDGSPKSTIEGDVDVRYNNLVAESRITKREIAYQDLTYGTMQFVAQEHLPN